jgi:cytidylate kinase
MILHRAIAIDGPAASGKSTLARILSKRLGLIMVNSGAMYRAVTWKVLQQGVDPNNREAVVEALRNMELQCGVDGLSSTVAVDGVDPGEELRSEEVNANVSAVAAVPEVRECLVSLQRDYLKLGDVVMEGRDIGTVVFPETPYKIYMDADPNVREARREEIGEVDSVAARDHADSRRETAPLKIAEGAAILDTSGHTIETGVAAALEILVSQGFPVPESAWSGGAPL